MPVARLARLLRTLRVAGPTATVVAYRAKKLGAKQKLLELATFLRHLRARPPQVVVEIGSLHGGTLWAWSRVAADDALIIGIDLPGGTFGGGFSQAQARRIESYRRRRQRLELIAADSHLDATRSRLDQGLDGREPDLLFIDGDHTYGGVARDFELYGPAVRSGGLIAFHDILPEPLVPDCEVHRFWEDVKPSFEHFELVDRDDISAHGPWGGIGVLVQPSAAEDHAANRQ